MSHDRPNFAFRGEPVWVPERRLARSLVPAGMLDWLLDPTSLTRRLQQACRGRFRVELLSLGRGRAMANEAALLAMRADGQAVVRQVLLLCGDTPWVFARTVIPTTTLRGRRRRLLHLGNRPLGAVLFADRSMRRGAVEVARIGPGQGMYKLATERLAERPEAIWGRRSVFFLDENPLLVSEVFLPSVGAAPR